MASKRVRNKIKNRESYKTYKGQTIAVNSPYSYKQCRVVLMYCPVQGVELYFRTVRRAKSYLDTLTVSDLDHSNSYDPNDDIPF